MVLVAPFLTLATKGWYKEDARTQVGICYSLCRSKSSSELMLSVSKRDVKQNLFIFFYLYFPIGDSNKYDISDIKVQTPLLLPSKFFPTYKCIVLPERMMSSSYAPRYLLVNSFDGPS